MDEDKTAIEVPVKKPEDEKVYIDLEIFTDSQLRSLAKRFNINLRFRKTRREIITKLKKHGPYYYTKKVAKNEKESESEHLEEGK